jgi:hypothetical protein
MYTHAATSREATMTWILALITTMSFAGPPEVTINKIGLFPDEQKCEATRKSLQENAEPKHTYICVKHE